MKTPPSDHLDPRYRSVLMLSAALNFAMLIVEAAVGLSIGSAALIADAADFLEDTGVYSLAVVAIAWTARARARAGIALSCAMAAVGLTALWQVVHRLIDGGRPQATPMALTAAAALAVNVFCASRLAPHKQGDASMRSIWLSTRNDAILNVVTILAAGLVAVSSAGWPDIVAGLVIAVINLWAAVEILRQGVDELKAGGG